MSQAEKLFYKNIALMVLIALSMLNCSPSSPNQALKILLNRDSISHTREVAWFDIRDTIDSSYFNLRFYPRSNYQTVLNGIANKKKAFKSLLEDSTNSEIQILNKAGRYIENTLVNEIIPYWYDTPWDFNGYTNAPNKGTVACGYFVSTTLKHLGFNLNRYRFAQQYGKVSGESLQNPMTIIFEQKINLSDDKAIKNALKNEGLYFVGLDCHVGYLLYRKNKLFFIHSSYTEPFKVVIEDAMSSVAFTSSAFYFSAISTNNELIKKWILGTEIEIK